MTRAFHKWLRVGVTREATTIATNALRTVSARLTTTLAAIPNRS